MYNGIVPRGAYSGKNSSKVTSASSYGHITGKNSRSFYHFLVEIQDGKEFLTKIRPDSDKSGAAMGAAPIGIYPTVEKVIKAATIQAAITHNTPDKINAAIAAALMSHYFIYRLGVKRKLGQFIEGYVSGEWSKPWQGKVKSLMLDEC